MALMPYEPAPGKFPAAYIRESSEDWDRDLDAQKAGQREDVRAVATRDGADPDRLHWYDDWGRSGSEHAKRPAQDRLLSDIKAGRVSVIYARSLDRLMRSTQRLRDLWKLCEATGTRVVTMREGDVSADRIEQNPSAWMFVQSIMTAAEYESRVGRVRAAAGIATKLREGQRLGRLPYGEAPGDDLAGVLAAWDETRSFNGTAKLLNERKVPTRVPGAHWDATSAAQIIRRHRVLPKVVQRGRAAKAPRMFSGLLRCPCGDTMSSMPRRKGAKGSQTETIAYFCRRAHATPAHPRPYVIAERYVRAWAEHELADVKEVVAARRARKRSMDSDQQRRGALLAQREGFAEAYAMGAFGAVGTTPAKDALARRLAQIDKDLEGLEAAEAVSLLADGNAAQVAYVDWDDAPGEVNERLRTLWTAVDLAHVDGTLRPVKPQWVPGVWERLYEGQDSASEDIGRDGEAAPRRKARKA